MAARKGLEPLTFALGKRCSILLSYRAALRVPGSIAQVSGRANPEAEKRDGEPDGGNAMAMLRPLKTLYIQVLIGIALGILVGALWPELGVKLKPLGDAFIKLVKLVIAPVIFLTVASGIAHMGDIK